MDRDGRGMHRWPLPFLNSIDTALFTTMCFVMTIRSGKERRKKGGTLGEVVGESTLCQGRPSTAGRRQGVRQ